MTWTKLSDDYSDDCWTLSDQAFRLHTEGLVWSNRKLLNLRIPKDEVRRFAKHPDVVEELLAGEWWIDDGDAYVIVHHGRYQRDRDAVIKQQSVNAANGARGGRPPAAVRELVKAPSPKFSETESQSGSLGQSRSEMDRPIQAATTQPSLKEKKAVETESQSRSVSDSVSSSGWPVATIPSGGTERGRSAWVGGDS